VGFHTRTGETYVFHAKAVIMCTGPYGIPYHRQETTYVTRSMPIDASGEGIHAMWEAGAVLGKLEIGIKSPSPIEFDCAPALEMLTALGGHTIWVNRLGQRFLAEEFRKKDFGRSSVASAILKEYLEGRGPAGINVSHLRPDERRLLRQVVPIVVGNFESAGYDLARDTIPYSVGVPAGKCVSGAGARINEKGETSVAGLYAAGNCSDGAYICLGQTLYVCGLTGWWAGEAAAEWVRADKQPPEVNADQVALHEERYSEPRAVKGSVTLEEVRNQVAEIQLGLTPTLNARNLGAALDRLGSLVEEKLPRLGASDARELARVNALKVSLPIMRLVLEIMEHRKESRGNLIRDDFPFTDNDALLAHTVVQRTSDREKRLWDIPVPEDWWILRPPRGKFLHPYFQGANP
jgi:succinate dehydrogenase/fumarate reductase flavoprotein subunit